MRLAIIIERGQSAKSFWYAEALHALAFWPNILNGWVCDPQELAFFLSRIVSMNTEALLGCRRSLPRAGAMGIFVQTKLLVSDYADDITVCVSSCRDIRRVRADIQRYERVRWPK